MAGIGPIALYWVKYPSILADLVAEYAGELDNVCKTIKAGVEAARKQFNRAAQVVLAVNGSAVLAQLEERMEALAEFVFASGSPRAKWIGMKMACAPSMHRLLMQAVWPMSAFRSIRKV